MKIAVYAISKNESKFVKRWYESMKEADDIFVLDTGSTDDTVELMESLGIKVKRTIIDPFRFDIARNKSLELVPKDYDICVCTDLDEIFIPGWRKLLENSWTNDTTRLRYLYNWNVEKKISFMYSKIHKRQGYCWKYPVHEVLIGKNEIIVENKDIVLNHYPDNKKSRNFYLGLLELSLEENPTDPRCYHYLGREYMYCGFYEKAISTLLKHINLPNSKWKEERCTSYRFISKCYLYLGRIEESKMYLYKAINELSKRKESYVELAYIYYLEEKYDCVIYYLLQCKSIKENQLEYVNEAYINDSTIDDLLSYSYYKLDMIEESLFYCNKALLIDPKNDRLRRNKEILESIFLFFYKKKTHNKNKRGMLMRIKDYIKGIFLGILISSINVLALNNINCSSVTFDNSTTDIESTNVQDTIDELNENIKILKQASFFKLNNIESIYYKNILNSYGENINVNYKVPEGVNYILLTLNRTYAFTTYYSPTISGNGYIKTIKKELNSEGSQPPYSQYFIYLLKVIPGATINIKTNDINLSKIVGNYTTSLVVSY